MKKPKTYKYYTWMSWEDPDEGKITMNTQLYDCVGIYVALTAPSGRNVGQFHGNPKKFGSDQRRHVIELKAKGIAHETGSEKEVYEDEDGMWKEWTEGQNDKTT